MKRLYLSILCITLGGCILASPTKQTPVFMYPDLVITMQRGLCLGSCPVYTLTILGDGSVFCKTSLDPAVKSQYLLTLHWRQIRDLVTAIYKADFFSLRDAYRIPAYDLPSVILSITIDGRSKRIFHPGSLGCNGVNDFAPPQLCDLEEKIVEIVNTYQRIPCR